jgi:hypothetical protein
MLYETIDHNHRRLKLFDSTYMPQGYFIGPGLVSTPLIIRSNVLIKFSDLPGGWLLLRMSLSQYKTQVLLSYSFMVSTDSG